MAIETTPRGVPYPKPGSGEPNNPPVHFKQQAEWIDANVPKTADLGDPETEAGALLLASTGDIVVNKRRVKDTIIPLGDSTVAMGGGPILVATTAAVDQYAGFKARGALNWALTLLRHPLVFLHNGGHSGYRADQLVPLFEAQVADFDPGWVDIQVGVNDVYQGRTVSQITTSLTELYDAAAAAGIRVLANTITTATAFAGATTTASRSIGDTSVGLSDAAVAIGDELAIDTGANREIVTATSGRSGAGSVNVSAMTKAHASGVLVVNLTKMAVLNGVNHWLDQYVRTHPNVILADLNAVYSDPSTGGPGSGMAADGLHQTATGAMALGKAKADALQPFMPVIVGRITAGDPLNYSPNPTQDGTSGSKSGGPTGQVSTGFTLIGTSATAVASKVARTDGQPGYWQEIDVTDGGTANMFFQTSTLSLSSLGLAVGDLVWAEWEIEGDDDFEPNLTTQSSSVDCYITFVGGSGNAPRAAQMASNGSDGPGAAYWPAKGRLRTQAVPIPVGTTGIQHVLTFRLTSGTLRVGRNRITKGAIA